MTNPKTWLPTCLLVATFLFTGTAHAKYAPPPVEDVFGTSELVVSGEITKLTAKTFVLAVDEVAIGDVGSHVTIQRFENWTCAHRWAPYKVGQKVLVFASKHPDTRSWRIRSAGGEGEMPIIGDKVVLRGFVSLATTESTSHETPGGKVYGQLVALADVLDAARNFRTLYTVKVSGDRWPRVQRVKPTGSDAKRAAFVSRSELHQALGATAGD